MDQLVAENVVGVPVGTGHRHDDTVLHGLCHTTGTLTDESGKRIGLLKVGMISVEDDRLRGFKLVLEGPGQSLVPTLAHADGVHDGFFFFRIEVPVEVIRRQKLKIKVVELNLVSPKVLSGSLGGHPGGTKAHHD